MGAGVGDFERFLSLLLPLPLPLPRPSLSLSPPPTRAFLILLPDTERRMPLNMFRPELGGAELLFLFLDLFGHLDLQLFGVLGMQHVNKYRLRHVGAAVC